MAKVKSIRKSVQFLERMVGRLTLIGFILFIIILLTSTEANGQNLDKTVEYNPITELYQVTDHTGNYYHVNFEGEINGPFKYTYDNVVLTGNMKDGKRHGLFKTTIKNPDGFKTIVVLYDEGSAIRIKETQVYAVN